MNKQQAEPDDPFAAEQRELYRLWKVRAAANIRESEAVDYAIFAHRAWATALQKLHRKRNDAERERRAEEKKG